MSLIKAKDTTSNIGSSTQPFEKIYANNLPKKIVVSGDANGTGTFDDNGNMSLSLAVEQNTTGISFKGVLNGENLDNVLEDGYYIQRLDGGAQPNLNYPIALGGMLFVISYRNSQDVVEFTFQQYQSTSGLFFTRSYNKTANKFSDWTSGGEITFTDIVPVGTIARFPEDNINELPNDWSVIDETYDANKVIDGDKSVSQEIKECKENILQDNITTDLLEDYSGISSDYGAEILKINGKSHQITTNGYQLFDASKLSTKSQGGATVTNNGDGSFTVSGSGSLNDNCRLHKSISNIKASDYFKVGKLTFNADGITYPRVFFQLWEDGVKNLFNIDLVGKTSGSVEITQDMLNRGNKIEFGIVGSTNQPIKAGTIKPMLYQDGDGTWEPFTGGEPSPNPSYPQEIRNALDEPLVSVSRNLFDANGLKLGGAKNLKIEENGYKISLESNGGYRKAYYEITGNVLNALKGNSIKLKYSEGTVFDKNSNLQIIIKRKNEENKFYGVDRDTFETKAIDITEDVELIKIELLPANLSATLESYQKLIVVGLRLYDVSNGEVEWEPYKYAETNLNFQRMCSVPSGTCDTYENGVSTQRIGLYGFNGHSREDWKIDKTYTDCTRFYIVKNDIKRRNDYTNSIMCNRLKTLTSHTTKDKGISSYTNSDYPNQNWIYVNGFNEFTTVEQFKEWLGTHPINIQYELETPIVLKVDKPIVPTFYPYTNIFQSDDVKAHIKYRLRSKADYAISLIENLTKAMTVKSIDGTTSLNVSEILSKTMPIINGISFYDYDVSNSIRELSKYYPTVSLQSENEENIDEQFNQLGDVTQEIPRIENITKEEDNNENK